MRRSPRSRDKSGLGPVHDAANGPAGLLTDLPTSSPTQPRTAKNPPSASSPRLGLTPQQSSGIPSDEDVSEAASEIIVQSETMELEDSGLSGPPIPSTDGPQLDTSRLEETQSSAPSEPVSARTSKDSIKTPTTNASEHSEQSEPSTFPSPVSSKATTPVDLDSTNDSSLSSTQRTPPPPSSRPTYNVRPRSSVPSDIDHTTYARECIQAAEASRLDPFALHQEEYQMLRKHISQSQVTTYLCVRNAILRLWIRNTREPVARDKAIGCASTPWFDAANVCFDWLVRRGFINFGCVNLPPVVTSPSQSTSDSKRKTIVVIGGGMSGLGCARQLESLGNQYSHRFQDIGELPPRVIVLEARSRVGGRVYSREFKTKPTEAPVPGYEGQRCTAEMGGMIITGFERGNPMNVLVRGQLGLSYRALKSETTIYDSNGRPVDLTRDQLVEKLYNDCLDRVSEFKFKPQPLKVVRGNPELIEQAKDGPNGGGESISQSEEAAAALPDARPVSEQNVPERVNRVPVSADKLTGRVHTEPGTPATQKASIKAKAMGWTLKKNISQGANIDLAASATKENATLGSVLDEAIVQYRSLVDLTAQDHRLANWHIANLEYSNATNLHKLSLGAWDIDDGNEWEGRHTMVVGGYQSVPRGLAQCPSPLDVRTKAPIRSIHYSTEDPLGSAKVECEDGTTHEADYIVSTIPLGVLKRGTVEFNPPLPEWKTDAIERIGFGVLNKVVLVYKEPFWDTDRHIFGVLRDAANRHSLVQSEYSSQRGRFFQWFNVSDTSGLPCLVALMAGDAGYATESESNDHLIEEATGILRSVFGGGVPYPLEAVVTRWASDRFARGSYSSCGPDMLPDDYDTMARPIGNLFFAGEHTIGTHPATVHGAFMSGLRAASEILESILGPIDVPTPLIRPKDRAPSLKRKARTESVQTEQKAPATAPTRAQRATVAEFITSKIGPRPLPPVKATPNGYMLYSKQFFDIARKRCEEERPGNKKRPTPNDVRVMTSKMWRNATAEERKPYEEEAVRLKSNHAVAVLEFEAAARSWNEGAAALREEFEKNQPTAAPTSANPASAEPPNPHKHRRTSRHAVS